MSAITLAQAQAQLAFWMAADAAVASGQEYKITESGTERMLRRADAGMITKKISFWAHEVNRKQGRRAWLATPVDL